MKPDVSRAIAAVRNRLELEPGPTLDRLIEAGRSAESVDDLPDWVRAVLDQIGRTP